MAGIFGAETSIPTEQAMQPQPIAPVKDESTLVLAKGITDIADTATGLFKGLQAARQEAAVDKETRIMQESIDKWYKAVEQGKTNLGWARQNISRAISQASGGDVDRAKKLQFEADRIAEGYGYKAAKTPEQLAQEAREAHYEKVIQAGNLNPDDEDFPQKYGLVEQGLELDARYQMEQQRIQREAFVGGYTDEQIKLAENKQKALQQRKLQEYQPYAMQTAQVKIDDIVNGRGEYAGMSKEERGKQLLIMKAQLPKMKAGFSMISSDRVDNTLINPISAQIDLAHDTLTGKVSGDYAKQQSEATTAILQNKMIQNDPNIAVLAAGANLVGADNVRKLALHEGVTDITLFQSAFGITQDKATGKTTMQLVNNDTASNGPNTLSSGNKEIAKLTYESGVNMIKSLDNPNTPKNVKDNQMVAVDSLLIKTAYDINTYGVDVSPENAHQFNQVVDFLANDSTGSYIKRNGWPQGSDIQKASNVIKTQYIDTVNRATKELFQSTSSEGFNSFEYVEVEVTPTGPKFKLTEKARQEMLKLDAERKKSMPQQWMQPYYPTRGQESDKARLDKFTRLQGAVNQVNKNYMPRLTKSMKAMAHIHGEEFNENIQNVMLPSLYGDWETQVKVTKAAKEYGVESVGKAITEQRKKDTVVEPATPTKEAPEDAQPQLTELPQ